jgi:hypothetical protein
MVIIFDLQAIDTMVFECFSESELL